MRLPIFAFVLSIVLNLSCTDKAGSQGLSLPAHFPVLNTPADNLLTPARITLGKNLFFDKNLSIDSTISCQSCHIPELAFTDGRKVSIGIKGRLGKRNAPSLINAGYLPALNKDGGVRSLDIQALVPIEDENEMGISMLQLVDRFRNHEHYQQLAMEAYGDSLTAFSITRALATFVRSLSRGTTNYDHFLRGDTSALSPSALEGLRLFESDRLNCTACHSGFNFTNNSYKNNGLYEDYQDIGRALITLDSLDIGSFRVPSLRNVAITPPYMHDGSLASIDDVLTHYETVGSQPTPFQSDQLADFSLTTEERSNLVAFLECLTDQNKSF